METVSMLSDEQWASLVDAIEDRRCTPIIGAGACAGLLPLGGQLAKQIATDFKFPIDKDSENLSKVAQFLAVKFEDSAKPRREIAIRLKPVLNGQAFSIPDDNIHHLLADLNSPLYLTTNYDDLMTRALNARSARLEGRRKPGLAPVAEVCRWNPELLQDMPSIFDEGTRPAPERPVVFHLHGNLETPESMVASEDDYLDFLIEVSKDVRRGPISTDTSSDRPAKRKTVLPLPIRRALRGTSLLFIGYSLEDVNLRMILRALIGPLAKANRRLNITLQLEPDQKQYSDPRAVREYLEKYFHWTLDLRTAFGTASSFAGTLREKLVERGAIDP
jgi:hypothetical protein